MSLICTRRQLGHVEVRAEQALLLAAEEDETHLVGRLDAQLVHLLGGLQHHADTRPVVVDTRALVHRIEMTTHDDSSVGSAAGRLSDHVVGDHVLVDEPVHLHPQRDGLTCGDAVDERPARRVVRPDHRDPGVVAGQRRDQHVVAVRRSDGALVEEHSRSSARLPSDLRLQSEVAGAPLQQHDPPGDIQAVVVRRLTSGIGGAGLRRRLGEIDNDRLGGDVTIAGEIGRVPHASLTVVADVDLGVRRDTLERRRTLLKEDVRLELLQRHDEAGRFHHVDHVVDGRLMARGSGRPCRDALEHVGVGDPPRELPCAR